jgi:hypothetical protein
VRLHGGRRERGRIQLEFSYFYDTNKGAKKREQIREKEERRTVFIRNEKRSSSSGKL